MECCKCKTGATPADWSQDSREMKRARFAYWFTGWATGPDTVMGALWSVGFLYAASTDATCHAGPTGLSSGADGAACTLTDNWNQTLFQELGGDACYGATTLGSDRYYHDPSKSGCMAAFTAYRAVTPFTCNCSGASADHAYLAAGGARPSVMFTLATTIGLVVTACLQPCFGTAIDFTSKRKRLWWVLTILCGISTCGMAVIGTAGLWNVGLAACISTIVTSEVVIPIRASFLEDVAKDKATIGYVGAMRQVSSYASQLLCVIIFVAFQFVVPSEMTHSMFFSLFAGVWFMIFMALCLKYFVDHPAKRVNEKGTNMVVLSFTELANELSKLRAFPEAYKFLIATAILQVGGPVIVAVASTFATQGLEMPSILYSVVTLCVLAVGLPSAFFLAKMIQIDCMSFKKAWIIICIYFILIAGLVPLLADGPNAKSWYMTIVLAGLLGGIALSWYYSVGWTCFYTMVPFGHGGQYAGIYNATNTIFNVFGPLIYSAVVQATNNHQIGWLVTCMPPCLVALAIILCCDFEKGRRDANRDVTDLAPKIETPTTASS